MVAHSCCMSIFFLEIYWEVPTSRSEMLISVCSGGHIVYFFNVKIKIILMFDERRRKKQPIRGIKRRKKKVGEKKTTFFFVIVLFTDLFTHWPKDHLVLKYISKMKWK